MAYWRTDFGTDDIFGTSAQRRPSNEDDYFLARRVERALESPAIGGGLKDEYPEARPSKYYTTTTHESKMNELEYELRRSRDLEEKHNQTIRQLKQVLDATEKESSELSKSRSKAQLTIGTLQADNRQLQERISDLESRLRRHLDERDETTHSALTWERNYDQLRTALCKMIFPDGIYESASHEAIIRKLEDHFDEQTKLKLQTLKLQEDISKTKEEARAERDALKKVLDELERTKKHGVAVELMKEEKEMAIRKQKQLEEELKKMDDRLLRMQERHESSQLELRSYHSKLTDVDTLTRRQTLAAQASALEFKSFKETLTALLSDIYSSVQPTEESLKDKIRQLIINKQEVDHVSKHLEEKLPELSKQLEEQAHLHKNAVQRARKAEDEAHGLKERLRALEGELSATDILKNGLKADKHKYAEFCQQLAHAMKLDTIADELGMDLNGDALLARAEQLANTEHESVAKKRSQSLVVERQLKEAKKQLESKEAHLDVMRKKLAGLETEASHKAEKDWQDFAEKHDRLRKHNDKLEKQLSEHKMSLNQMAHHGETAETLRRTCDQQRKALVDLEKQLNESEQVRAKQSKKLQQLRTEKDHSEVEMGQHQHTVRAAESSVQNLTEETQRLKQQLHGMVQREKLLTDFRQVISRMLGLNADTLAVPDYEIIRRLESLVETQNELAVGSKGQADSKRSLHSNLAKSNSYGVDGIRGGQSDGTRRAVVAQGFGSGARRFK